MGQWRRRRMVWLRRPLPREEVVLFFAPEGVFLLPTPRHADARRIERDGAAEAAALFAGEHEPSGELLSLSLWIRISGKVSV